MRFQTMEIDFKEDEEYIFSFSICRDLFWGILHRQVPLGEFEVVIHSQIGFPQVFPRPQPRVTPGDSELQTMVSQDSILGFLGQRELFKRMPQSEVELQVKAPQSEG